MFNWCCLRAALLRAAAKVTGVDECSRGNLLLVSHCLFVNNLHPILYSTFVHLYSRLKIDMMVLILIYVILIAISAVDINV